MPTVIASHLMEETITIVTKDTMRKGYFTHPLLSLPGLPFSGVYSNIGSCISGLGKHRVVCRCAGATYGHSVYIPG